MVINVQNKTRSENIGFCCRYISLYPSFVVCPSFILRSFSVRSSIGKRSANGVRTERERRTNGERTENERRTNGERTENERRTNGERTENERRTMRKIYHRICWADCNTVSLLIIFQELIKNNFGT